MSIGRREVLIAASTAAAVSSIPVSAAPVRQSMPNPMEQTIAMAAITQVINEWAHEVDTNYGRGMIEADVLTRDCRCKLENQWISGLDAIARFYKSHFEGVDAKDDKPIIRQLLSNFRISFVSRTEAKVGLSLELFFKVGKVPFSDYCDPVEVADVRVDCRRGADGRWRISMLDSDRIFRKG